MQDLNTYIKPSHIRAVEKFKAELEKYKEQCDPEGTLYEDPFTSFTLDEIEVVNGRLRYLYDGKPDSDIIVRFDDEACQYYEDEGLDSLMEIVKFWRKCLRRAQRYWTMDNDELDALQNGEVEEEEED